MGSGIAQVSAQTGHRVTIVDVSENRLSRALEEIKENISKAAQKKFRGNLRESDEYIDNTLSRIEISTDPCVASENADIIIEAIVENLEEKRSLFSLIDKVAPKNALLASNTSSFAIEDIAGSTEREDKFGGLHFFNPVPVMKLLEVVRTSQISSEAFTSLLEYGKAIGKVVVETKDTPGFIVNRLLLPYFAESIWMCDRGDATLSDIDVAMKLGAGFPMGPFQLMDFCGLDTTKYAIAGIAKKINYPGISSTPILLDKLVAEGKLGIKTGAGFYEYSSE